MEKGSHGSDIQFVTKMIGGRNRELGMNRGLGFRLYSFRGLGFRLHSLPRPSNVVPFR